MKDLEISYTKRPEIKPARQYPYFAKNGNGSLFYMVSHDKGISLSGRWTDFLSLTEDLLEELKNTDIVIHT